MQSSFSPASHQITESGGNNSPQMLMAGNYFYKTLYKSINSSGKRIAKEVINRLSPVHIFLLTYNSIMANNKDKDRDRTTEYIGRSLIRGDQVGWLEDTPPLLQFPHSPATIQEWSLSEFRLRSRFYGICVSSLVSSPVPSNLLPESEIICNLLSIRSFVGAHSSD